MLSSSSCGLLMPSTRMACFGQCRICHSDRASVFASSSSEERTPADGIQPSSQPIPTTIPPGRKPASTSGLPLLSERTGGEARRDLVGRPWCVPRRRADRSASRLVWQSDTLTRLLQSVLVVPLTTNLDRANLAGTALVSASDGGLTSDSVAIAFQMRAIPKERLKTRIRSLSVEELAELELATDEAVGRVEPEAEPD